MPMTLDPSLQKSMRDLFDRRTSPWGTIRFPLGSKGKPLKSSQAYMGLILVQADNDAVIAILSDAVPLVMPGDAMYSSVANLISAVLPPEAAAVFKAKYCDVVGIHVAVGMAAWVPSTLYVSMVNEDNGDPSHVAISQNCVTATV